MAHSGLTEVASFAALAVNTGNKILGAAVVSKLDALPKRERELVDVSRQELANILCGDDHRKAQEAITIARNRVQSSLNLNREFERGRANAKARIGEALANPRFQSEAGFIARDVR